MEKKLQEETVPIKASSTAGENCPDPTSHVRSLLGLSTFVS